MECNFYARVRYCIRCGLGLAWLSGEKIMHGRYGFACCSHLG